MRKEYGRNKKIAIYGNSKAIAEAEAILDTLEGMEDQSDGWRLYNEGAIRLKIQDAIDTHNIKAGIYVDGNMVYPYKKTIRQYEQLKKSGELEKMTNYFYEFLHLNFDIAYYNKHDYIWYYGNDFSAMQKAVLDTAKTAGWQTDIQRILNNIQGRSIQGDTAVVA